MFGRRSIFAVGLLMGLTLAVPAGVAFAAPRPTHAATDDPCAPSADGSVPPMCQSGAPIPPSGAFFEESFSQLVVGDSLSRRVFDVAAGTISYAGGTLQASVGCNRLSATADFQLGGPLTLTSPIMSTKMYCEGLMDAESALITILEGGDLALTNDGITGSAGLIRIDGGVHIAMPDGVNPGGSGFAPDGSGAPILSIESNGATYEVGGGTFSLGGGEIYASVGCNSIGGSAELEGDRIVLSGELRSTLMYCEGLMDAEAALNAVLRGENLRFSGAYTVSSDAGSFTIAPTLCCPAPGPGPTAPSDPWGLAIAIALLLLPALVGAEGVRRGLSD